MSLEEARMINELDAPLHIDAICYSCRRIVALSNTIEKDGRKYCHRCLSYGINPKEDTPRVR